MNIQSSGRTKVLFSVIGVVGIIALLVAVNVISSAWRGRIDMTEEKLYTLSPGTRAILGKLEMPVKIRFYYSRGSVEMPVGLKSFATRVQDLLKEYEVASDGMIDVQLLDPEPDSDAEDSASFDGVHGQMLGNGDRIFLGLAVSHLEVTQSIPFLSPQREALMEYDITRAIYQLSHPEKPVLGLLTALPMMGTPPNLRTGQQMSPEAGRKWHVMQALDEQFDLRAVAPSSTTIDPDIDILLIVHPKEMPAGVIYAVDQFILGGGKVIAFVDPLSFIEMIAQSRSQAAMMGMGGSVSSSLGPLFGAWGVTFDPGKVVVDLFYQTEWQEEGRTRRDPMILGMRGDAYSKDDPAVSELDLTFLPYVGAFSGQPVDGLSKDVLLQTSSGGQLIDGRLAQMPVDSIVGTLAKEGKMLDLIVRLSGAFPTAFPDGLPAAPGKIVGGAEDEATPAAAADGLKSGQSAVILVADSDLLHDFFCIERLNFMGQQIIQPRSDNLALLLNLVEQLSGDENLLGIRSRGTQRRPFIVIQEKKVGAEARYQQEIDALETELAETEGKLREIATTGKGQDQRFVLTPEQREAITTYRKREADTRKRLKEVRKEFRKEIVAIERNVKLANIALVPALVALAGLAMAVVKWRRMGKNES